VTSIEQCTNTGTNHRMQKTTQHLPRTNRLLLLYVAVQQIKIAMHSH